MPLYTGDKSAILHHISLGQFSKNPPQGLVNQRTISSRLKGNKYFGHKNPSDWANFVKKKLISVAIKMNKLCASLALDTLDAAGSALLEDV